MNSKQPLKISDIETCRYRWDMGAKISSIVVGLILGFACVTICIAATEEKEALLPLFIILAICFGIVAIRPIGLIVDDDYIALKQQIGRQLIDKSDILSITEVDRNFFKQLIRSNGSNGPLGYLGTYRHRKMGKIVMFCTDRNGRLALIETSTKKYLINY